MARGNRSFPLLPSFIRSPLSLLEEGEEELHSFPDIFNPNGLTISEDDKSIYVEAQLPGLNQNDVQITMDDNILWIKGEKQEEKSDKSKHFYQKATSSFSYRVAIPKKVDPNQEPEACFENGELKICFKKAPQKNTSKEIQIKKKK